MSQVNRKFYVEHKEEIFQYLDRYSGLLSTKQIADHFGISEDSVRRYQEKLGMPKGFKNNTSLLNRTEVAQLLGLSQIFTESWERAGFKWKKIGGYCYSTEEKVVEFMRTHPDLWDYDRCDKVFFSYYDWFNEFDKSKQHFRYARKWDAWEDQVLKLRVDSMLPLSSISKELNRTKASLKLRLRKMGYHFAVINDVIHLKEEF